MEMIKVGMADYKATKSPGVLITFGLGSCVGIALYDKSTKVSGLAHVMLPSSKEIKNNSNKAKFADTGIDALIDEMVKLGARKSNIVAKIAGGAQMFSFSSQNDMLRIGERNAIASKEKLKDHRIRILAEDTGGNFGRTIELNTETGELQIKTIGHGIKVV
ncbi:chemoreceptor glutamine deamidase CheD [Andreesenia angusta]|uniref:Probable chemoreceptor glutamine deamidase CheD n=1 Tax=Andreesenia angusta TaxID=39480 RepID=A0A1S1V867_9FIRM|nr:chemotaxis protein CheD [Andreesenia angusta]OHW62782.1 chemoreceptor glutamine deamidase CheD [Andreesenia angusta]